MPTLPLQPASRAAQPDDLALDAAAAAAQPRPIWPAPTQPTRRSDDAPAQNFAPELLLAAQGVRVLLLDVDGVLTDGGLYFDAGGEALKRFHTLDGHGLKLLEQAGLRVAVISGRDSPALRARLDGLGLHLRRLGQEDKHPAAVAVLRELELDWAQAAAMGDDWPDLPLLSRCALAACPPQAHPEVRARVHLVTQAGAGAGAVREVCDLLLSAQARYASALRLALAGTPAA